VDEMDRILAYAFGHEQVLAELSDILIIDSTLIGLLLAITVVILAPLG